VRRIEDSEGAAWDVVIGRESWGAVVALFVPSGHEAPVRQTMLAASTPEQAATDLDALTTTELGALLKRSLIKES
jgi:hypothetical protein